MFLLIISGVFASSFTTHSVDEYLINVNSIDYTIRQAIDNDLLRGGYSYAAPLLLYPQTHSANEIWVSLNGGEFRFIDALNTIGVCKTEKTLSYLFYPSYPYFHYANDTSVNEDSTLQNLIDSGVVASIDGDWGDSISWGECSSSCGGGIQAGTRTCDNPAPFCGGMDCMGDGIVTRDCNTQACQVYYWTNIGSSTSGYIINSYNTWSACSKIGQACTVPNNAVLCTPPNSRMMINAYVACK